LPNGGQRAGTVAVSLIDDFLTSRRGRRGDERRRGCGIFAPAAA